MLSFFMSGGWEGLIAATASLFITGCVFAYQLHQDNNIKEASANLWGDRGRFLVEAPEVPVAPPRVLPRELLVASVVQDANAVPMDAPQPQSYPARFCEYLGSLSPCFFANSRRTEQGTLPSAPIANDVPPSL